MLFIQSVLRRKTVQVEKRLSKFPTSRIHVLIFKAAVSLSVYMPLGAVNFQPSMKEFTHAHLRLYIALRRYGPSSNQ